mmetsp:Transcript_12307/g.30649  ORF Transcript_12307/g.30649 Transcript_12307/m.30649 type:complete len:86 (-) Transcript_12307:346-603(-)
MTRIHRATHELAVLNLTPLHTRNNIFSVKQCAVEGETSSTSTPSTSRSKFEGEIPRRARSTPGEQGKEQEGGTAKAVTSYFIVLR